MRHIPIGTCIPGDKFYDWAPKMKQIGYECFSLNHHMHITDEMLADFPKKVAIARDELGAPITTLGYYCNALMYDEHKQLLAKCIKAASAQGVTRVSTFAGALENESVDAAMPKFKEVYTELAKLAEDSGVKICFENCPMGGSWNSGTCNIAFNARAWELMFDAVPSDALGLEWEPAHQISQLVDPIANLRTFASKVYHMHGKDGVINWDMIKKYGVRDSFPMAPNRFPGFGETDWRKIFTILLQNGYESDITVEGYHDPLYSGEWEMTGQKHALEYLLWCEGGQMSDIEL